MSLLLCMLLSLCMAQATSPKPKLHLIVPSLPEVSALKEHFNEGAVLLREVQGSPLRWNWKSWNEQVKQHYALGLQPYDNLHADDAEVVAYVERAIDAVSLLGHGALSNLDHAFLVQMTGEPGADDSKIPFSYAAAVAVAADGMVLALARRKAYGAPGVSARSLLYYLFDGEALCFYMQPTPEQPSGDQPQLLSDAMISPWLLCLRVARDLEPKVEYKSAEASAAE